MKQRLAVFLTAVAAVTAWACNNEVTGLAPPSNPATETFHASLGVNLGTMVKLPSGVYYADLTVGNGDKDTTNTDSVFVNYAGHLKDGTQFDIGTNSKFDLAAGVLLGVRLGLIGMKAGGKRKLVIPSALGYGRQSIRDTNGQIKIPRQSTLIFDIDLLKVFNPVDTTQSTLVSK